MASVFFTIPIDSRPLWAAKKNFGLTLWSPLYLEAMRQFSPYPPLGGSAFFILYSNNELILHISINSLISHAKIIVGGKHWGTKLLEDSKILGLVWKPCIFQTIEKAPWYSLIFLDISQKKNLLFFLDFLWFSLTVWALIIFYNLSFHPFLHTPFCTLR